MFTPLPILFNFHPPSPSSFFWAKQKQVVILACKLAMASPYQCFFTTLLSSTHPPPPFQFSFRVICRSLPRHFYGVAYTLELRSGSPLVKICRRSPFSPFFFLISWFMWSVPKLNGGWARSFLIPVFFPFFRRATIKNEP